MGYARLTNLDITSSLSIDTDIKAEAKDNPTFTGEELHTGSSISSRVYHEYDERDEAGEPIRDDFNVDSYGNYTCRQRSLKAQEIVALSFKLQKYRKFCLILLLSHLLNATVLFLNFGNLSAKCKVCKLMCPFYFVSLP